MTTEFLGTQLSGPFTFPSGIVTTAPAIFQRVMDTMPEVGVITTASTGFEPHHGNREPVLGGPDGALVLSKLCAPDGQLTEQLDKKGNTLRTLTTGQLRRFLKKQGAAA